MALTWQDVAGVVPAPDFTDASKLITSGIAGLGEGVRALGEAPEKRRQEDLAKQLLIAEMQQKGAADQASVASTLGKEFKARRQEKDQQEFGAAQSILEATAADYAIQGKTFEDFMQTDVYKKLGEGAKAYGAAHLSDAFRWGTQARDERLAREQNDRVQMAQLALQRENLALSRASRADAAASRKLTDQINQERLGALQREKEAAKFADSDLGRVTARVSANYMDAAGRAYENKDWGQIAKQAGIDDYSEYKESLNALNAVRIRQGKRPLPEGAAKALLANQIGKNSGLFLGFPRFVNEVDQDDIDAQLRLVADQFDAASAEADIVAKFRRMYDEGIDFTDTRVQAELQRARSQFVDPPADRGTLPPRTGNTWRR